jgi:N-acetylmuramoyl-L-alanine amidase
MKFMQHSPLRLPVPFRPLLTLFACVVSAQFSLVYADGAPKYREKPSAKPAVSAPDSLYQNEPLATLGGPAVSANTKRGKATPAKTKTNANAAIKPKTGQSEVPASENESAPSVIHTGEGNTSNPTASAQPPAAFGPTPFDLSRIRSIQIGSLSVPDSPQRVGNLDMLAPIVDYVAPLGISVTQADPKNTPTLFNTSPRDFFQINLPTGPPIVLAVNRATAWGKDEKGQPFETPLRSAPLVINQKLYLPIFSIAPLVGAATRLNAADGTLVVTPTIESVELFPVANTIAVTIKSSAPIPEGDYQVGYLKGDSRNAHRLYVDFKGFSMGFDAGNSTSVRLVANGTGDVTGVRAGQPTTVPNAEVTRVTFDLKRPLTGDVIRIEKDPTLFAMVMAQPQAGPRQPEIPREILEPPVQPITSVTPVSQSLRGISVVVDAGHGGKDIGARGARSQEKQHTLALATKVANNLRARGATVHMTRVGDTYPSLSDRVSFANSRRADLFISIHMNASVNKSARGTETFFYTGQSRNFASSIHSEFAKATGRPDRGIAQARFYVIRNTSMPSVLLECAFISNSEEENIAMSEAWRDRVARGITQGVNNYVARFMKGGTSG